MMDITLNQLKEIAEAGYHTGLSEEGGRFEIYKHDNGLDFFVCHLILIYDNDREIHLFGIKKKADRVQVFSGQGQMMYKPLIGCFIFDTLAAMRKMKELGLIEI